MPYYKNIFDLTGECSERGESAENSFGKLLAKKGEVKPASRHEQFRHIDYVLIDSKGKRLKYDVKAQKKISRKDDDVSDDLVWIEFISVTGNAGWLYGEADFIVFERVKDFLIIDRLKLREVVEKLCDLKDMVTSPKQAMYKGYRRFNRRDLISIVKMSDLEPVAHEILKKN